MQHRQQIREQFGILEEKLEELGAPADNADPDALLREALDCLRELSRLVHEQQALKSVPTADFLLRICGLLVQEAQRQKVEIAVAHYGEGRISLEMAELVMGAVVAGFRASLQGQSAVSRAARVKALLYATGAIYLEVRATSDEIAFRLLDDGEGFQTSDGQRFRKLREHVAKCGGWFGHRAFEKNGGMIEFKIPLSHGRSDSYVVRHGDFEALVPSSCVAEIVRASRIPGGLPVYELNEGAGLVEGDRHCGAYVRIGVADAQFWVGCDSVEGPVRSRRLPADDFVEPGSWLRTFGIFQENGHGRALPLLDGATLLAFHPVVGGNS